MIDSHTHRPENLLDFCSAAAAVEDNKTPIPCTRETQVILRAEVGKAVLSIWTCAGTPWGQLASFSLSIPGLLQDAWGQRKDLASSGSSAETSRCDQPKAALCARVPGLGTTIFLDSCLPLPTYPTLRLPSSHLGDGEGSDKNVWTAVVKWLLCHYFHPLCVCGGGQRSVKAEHARLLISGVVSLLHHPCSQWMHRSKWKWHLWHETQLQQVHKVNSATQIETTGV